MMGEALLATAGTTIKLWDTNNYSLSHEIPFGNGRVSGLTLNQDGQCLASLGDYGDEIFLSAVSDKSAASIGVVRGVEAPSCVKFASRSPHYLGIGSTTGVVAIWNVKSQTKKKVFSPTREAIARVSFSHSDSHIAAATKKGTLYMLSVIDNSTAGPFKLFNNEVVTDLAYSSVKKFLLGCCSYGGSVCLYDCLTNKTVHAFDSTHSAPAAAVSFSPVNELLMISVGYDKKMACYNVQTKQAVMTHRSTAPLTSATFLGHGQRVALGTMTGQVFIHDLRTLRTPLATIKAHDTAVSSVLLQPLPKSRAGISTKGSSSSDRKLSKKTNPGAALSAPKEGRSKSCSDQPIDLNSDLKSKLASQTGSGNVDLDLLSPVRNTNPPPEIPMQDDVNKGPSLDFNPPCGAAGMQDLFSPVRATDSPPKGLFQLSQRILNEDNLLSPVRDSFPVQKERECGDLNSLAAQMEVEVSFGEEMAVSPEPARGPGKENLEPRAVLPQEHSPAIQESSKTTNIPQVTTTPKREERSFSNILSPHHETAVILRKDTSPATVENSQKVTNKCNFIPPNPPLINTPEPQAPKTNIKYPGSAVVGECEAVNTVASSIKPVNRLSGGSPCPQLLPTTTRPSPPKRQLLQPVQASDLDPETPPPAQPSSVLREDAPASNCNASQLQVELVRSCMVDVLEEFHDDIERRFMHLQYVITKHFIKQQEAMEQLHRQYSLNEDLLQENEKLRQQIAHLKARY